MIKIKALFISLIFITLTHTSFLGASSISHSQTDDKLASVVQDVESLVKHIEQVTSHDGSEIYTNREEVGKDLKGMLSIHSPLRPFPLLSIQTYETLIEALKAVLKKDEAKASSLLHVWSYMVGIPVVGLKHGRKYYEWDNHLMPEASRKECKELGIAIDAFQFCVRIPALDGADEKYAHLDMPNEVSVSALVCKEKRLQQASAKEIREVQGIGWPLLKDQLVSLERWESSLLADFMRKLLFKTVDNKLAYSYGLIELWKNTAIYFSVKDGEDSDVIVSPCSKNSVSYFGFQDGVFIENGTLRKGTYHGLFGKQFLFRGLFTKHPCTTEYPKKCDTCKTAFKALYEPHYSFKLLSDEGQGLLQAMRACGSYDLLESSFMRDFCDYVEGRTVTPNVSKKLIKYMNALQRKIVLSDSLPGENFLFNPTFSVELPKVVKSKDRQDNESLTPMGLISVLISHLECVRHQDTQSIDLSNNCIGDDEVVLLGHALDKNIVPDLETLNLSNNAITRKGLLALKKLLRRDTFQTLKIAFNRVHTLPAALESVADKVVGL